MITPSGRYLGRRPDSSDPKDHLFHAAHPEAMKVQLPPAVDLRKQLPLPCFDQGDESSCGSNMGAGMMSFLFPDVARERGGFSRHQIYHDVRKIEGTGSEDAGVETRDVFKTLTETGAAPEDLWPYKKETFAPTPPPAVYDEARKYKLSRYSRLTSGSNYLQCLASGFPFGLGIMLYESFDDEQTNKTGIMRMPQKGDKEVGGHDVLCVGYVLNFKTDPLFTTTGIASELVSDEMLMIRNSWGDEWSRRYRGHFFMPLQFALDHITGNDAWTGRR